MLSTRQVEMWALRVIDTLRVGKSVEDALVELKATWPNPTGAARRLAGHANAARGAEILWLIGADEAKGVVGAEPLDSATWWPQVARHFEGPAPDLMDLVLHTGETHLIALHFDTSRAPYVVRNPNYGKPQGGPVEFEVPWREGTAIRSARREDLLRLLVPLEEQPLVEPLEFRILREQGAPTSVQVGGAFYVVPRSDGTLVFPRHRTSSFLTLPDTSTRVPLTNVHFGPRVHYHITQTVVASRTIDSTDTELIVHGPGEVQFRASGQLPLSGNPSSEVIGVRIQLISAFSERPTTIDVLAHRFPPEAADSAEWRFWASGRRAEDA